MKHLWATWRMKYIQKNNGDHHGCVFCNALAKQDGPDNLIVLRGEYSFVILNKYPYASGHLMVVPLAHCANLEDLEPPARAEIMELASHAMSVLRKVYKPDGFNMGANIGAAAGAGVPGHIHIHILPRWAGDTNFMTSIGDTRVLPETLEITLKRVTESW